ncbi:MAG TPA: alpha/beta fold hydrolase [Acidobacteriaceae bacterium]
MAQHSSQSGNQPRNTSGPANAPPNTQIEVVSPVWLGKALALTFAVALLCAYLTACLLFYQGVWQLVLHPSHTVDRTPEAAGLPFTSVHFGDFSTGTPHLTGWWVPAETTPQTAAGPRHPALTILYLHSGSGSLSDTLPSLTLLHQTGLNVFAIDYRGFGASDASAHPDAGLMAQDAAAALDYLVNTQHVAGTSIVPMGAGVGASLAVQLARDHPELPAVILDNPDPDPAGTAAAASPSKIIPIRLLFGDRFAIAGPLAHLTTPKLLIAGGRSASSPATASLADLFPRAADPKYTVTLPSAGSDTALQDALRRFLDRYAPQR